MRAILTYHSIDPSGSAISIALEAFEDHVRWLSQRLVRVVPLDELLRIDPSDPADAVALTFDDGFGNFMAAADLLTHHGLPTTVFVVTSHAGGTNAWRGRADAGIPTLPLLDWAQLEQLAARGVTIGAHTRTHPALTRVSPAQVEDEMDGCVDELRARLGVAPAYFAYPYGAVNDRIAALAARRFEGSVTTRFDSVEAADMRAALPRLDMYYFRDRGALDAWGTPRFARRLQWVRARRWARTMLSGTGRHDRL